jgi:hypothetical protein
MSQLNDRSSSRDVVNLTINQKVSNQDEEGFYQQKPHNEETG